jgi:N-acetylmuramoyl-L-alanine amidase
MYKAFIDPGHGGPKDRYNVGPHGYVEADGVLKISKYLRDELLSTGQFEVKMSRETDIGVTVKDRGKMAAAFKADIAISEHTNAANGKARGATVFESVDLPDEKFAADIAKAIADAIGTNNRGGKSWESTNYPGEDYLGFIDGAQDGGCKHVFLVESAFHDNPEDEAILMKDENLKKIAVAQATVICKYFGVEYPAKTKLPLPYIKMINVSTSTMAGDPISIQAVGVNCKHIALFINDSWVNTEDGNTYSFAWTPAKEGTYNLTLKARNGEQADPNTTLITTNAITITVGKKV